MSYPPRYGTAAMEPNKLEMVKGEVEQVKELMIDNINRVSILRLFWENPNN